MDADAFLLFYIRRRIELDAGLEWYEAPYCGDMDFPPKTWLIIEQAALRFEQDNRDELEGQLIGRLTEGVDGKSAINFRAFKHIVDAYFELLQARLRRPPAAAVFLQQASSSRNLCVPLLALIAFTGLFARRLAEMGAATDAQQQDLPGARDFRREIYQVSIYGSAMLRSRLEQFGDDYSWDRFCEDTEKLLEYISTIKTKEPSGMARISIGGVICGIAAAGIAAYFLIARGRIAAAVH